MNYVKIKVFLFLLIAITYLLFTSGLPWVEAVLQLDLARNLVQKHTLSTSSAIAVEGPDGQPYDPHGITNALVMIPIACVELLLNKFGVQNASQLGFFLGALTGVIVNSLTCLIFFSLLLLLGRPLRISFYTTLCLAFMTIVFHYASTNYEGNLNMLFILSSIYFLFRYMKERKHSSLIASGVFGGLALNTREFAFIYLFCALMFVIVFFPKREVAKIIVLVLSGMFPLLVLFGYYNWVRTGSFYLTAHIATVLSGKWLSRAPTGNIMVGLKGLLLSKGGSIFIYSPILILATFGWKRFWRDKRTECIFILSIVILWILANAKMGEWFGLWGWGPRYTLAITPLMTLPLAYWLSSGVSHNKIKKHSLIFVGGFALLIQLSSTLTNWHGRLGHVLKKSSGTELFYFTARYSQWWDSIKTMCINLWNMPFSSFLHLENQGYSSSLSEASQYTSRTVFTWWNRLIFMGIKPMWVIMYVIISVVAIVYFFIYVMSLIEKTEKSNCKDVGNER